MEPRNEEALVRRATGGDGEALGTLWDANRRWVAAVLLAHRPSGVELEDLLQEVALRMIRRVHTLKKTRSLRPWLRTIAVNTARSAARYNGVRTARRTELDVEDLVDPARARERETAGARSRATETLALIRRLAPEHREPLLLRCVEGMSQRRIAETLDLPETTIESRLARARRLLRQELVGRDTAARARPSRGTSP
jgi:RNA polymerase sigma-70 factor (ECF subfamily)